MDYTIGSAMASVIDESLYPEGIGRAPAGFTRPAGAAERCVDDTTDSRICCDLAALACYLK